MSKYVNVEVARKAHINTLYFFIFVLLMACGALWYGWQTSPQNLRISIPPDLRDGAIVKPDEYQAATVFAFALNTLREIYRWEENGVVDYGKKIQTMQHRLSPAYREFLIRDMNIKNKAGELKDRVRYALELPGHSLYRPEFVQTQSDGTWVVTINIEIVERVASMEAKRVPISYPIRVVRMNISPERNIWGLALDGYPAGRRPEEIDLSKLTAKR